MAQLARVVVSMIGISCASLFGPFLGSEGTALMTTDRNLLLFGISLLGFLFCFRRYCVSFKKKYGLILVLYISLIFILSFFCYFLRIYLLSSLGLHFGALFSIILSVGGGQALPLPAPSGPSSSSSWTEDSFEMRVLLEPFSETEMEGTSVNSSIPGVARDDAGPSHQPRNPNRSFEASLQQRINTLEKEETLFLLDKERGLYWSEIKSSLDQARSQKEYDHLLEFENRDLQIREGKHSCYRQYQEILSKHPTLAEKAYYQPQETFLDFFNQKRAELDTHLEWSLAERDSRELLFLERVGQDLRSRGPNSQYISKMLGLG